MSDELARVVRIIEPEEVTMAVHDWTRVAAGIYHAFHTLWITHLMEALNGGRLPQGFYALIEQVAASGKLLPQESANGGVAVAEA